MRIGQVGQKTAELRGASARRGVDVVTGATRGGQIECAFDDQIGAGGNSVIKKVHRLSALYLGVCGRLQIEYGTVRAATAYHRSGGILYDPRLRKAGRG